MEHKGSLPHSPVPILGHIDPAHAPTYLARALIWPTSTVKIRIPLQKIYSPTAKLVEGMTLETKRHILSLHVLSQSQESNGIF
jgi:hypothetical protein